MKYSDAHLYEQKKELKKKKSILKTSNRTECEEKKKCLRKRNSAVQQDQTDFTETKHSERPICVHTICARNKVIDNNLWFSLAKIRQVKALLHIITLPLELMATTKSVKMHNFCL